MRPFWRLINIFNKQQFSEQVENVIFTIDEFEAILEREQARSKRHGHPLTLVVYFYEDDKLREEGFTQLLMLLLNRIRLTDEVGWFVEGQLGVLLPYTEIEGANKLAGGVVQAMDELVTPPKFDVYSFPTDWIEKKK